ncbi:ATP-binding protein [Streptomyces sp. NPDC051452]|uniref:ATP-binding protein n=1 Tax=Streptomyces sp. NPDC051452 TaxID=3365654 RepID=UPI0037AA66CA
MAGACYRLCTRTTLSHVHDGGRGTRPGKRARKGTEPWRQGGPTSRRVTVAANRRRGHRGTIALSGDGTCIAEARHQAAAFLTQHGDASRPKVTDRVLGLTQLVVSDLVTNACKYAPGPILLRLRLAGEALELEVWDSDPALPTPSGADPGRVGRYGLEIVKAVAADITALRENVGKGITARILLAAA